MIDLCTCGHKKGNHVEWKHGHDYPSEENITDRGWFCNHPGCKCEKTQKIAYLKQKTIV